MWKELGKLAIKAGEAYLENRDEEGINDDIETVKSVGRKLSSMFFDADDDDSGLDADEYTDSIIEHINAAAAEGQKYDILSEEFYVYMTEALGTGFSAINEFMEADPDLEYFEDNINRIDAVCSELAQSMCELCRGTEESRIKVEVEDYECDFEMVVTGAYPLNYDYKQTVLVGLVKKGRLQSGETVVFPDKIQVTVTDVFMFGVTRESCEAGDVVCLLVDGNHFDDFEYGTEITCRNAKPSPEGEYLREVKACLADDGTISDRERRLLDKLRKSLGLSEERAKEIEKYCDKTALTDEEQEYADEIKACLSDDNEISDKERRLLNRLYKSLNIADERAREIEQMIINK